MGKRIKILSDKPVEQPIVEPVNEDNTVDTIENNIDNLSIEQKQEEPVEPVDTVEPVEDTCTLKIGDTVKLKSNLDYDMLGKRIHNGVRNYIYTVRVVRPDGFCTIECLTRMFTVYYKDLTKVGE